MNMRLRLPSRSAAFVILMVGAALLALLPVAWTGWVRGVVQPLGWVQWTLSSTVRGADASLRSVGGEDCSLEHVRWLEAEHEGLKRQLGHQQLRIAGLEERVTDATGLREQLRDERVWLIIAPVVAHDASPRRETITIGRGSRSAGPVRVGQWVAAGARLAERDPEETGRELLMRQWLIGRVCEVWPYKSRVQLATDEQFEPLVVRPAKTLADGTWQPAEQDCALIGCGSGRMLIDRATVDYYATGATTVLVPASADLPAALTIGRIVSSQPIAEAPLHYDLEVRPWGDPRRLSYVYVISVEP
ncbi:MAG: hypothetical protein KKB50_01410 [Planctomycetes bacterium]|nr:hypothetical protein [Planctomycetota bacterium]